MKYEQTKDIGKSKSRAALWLKKNVMGFMPDTLITSIIVNHQGISEEEVSTLVSTMKAIYSALVDANLDKRIKVTTILSSTLIQDASSVPPSSSTKDLRDFAHSEEDLINSVVVAARNVMAFLHYPDIPIVINDQDMSCFQGLFFFPEAASLFFHNFCIYHIDAPGHELGVAAISSDIAIPTVDDLAEQVAEVLDYFGLGGVICMGVTAGAYILTLFALKYRERVLGLILISPLCQAPSWTEWFYNKVMMNLLYFYGMCGIVKESLLQRYFSQEVRCNIQGLESDIVQACRRLLDERQSSNVMRFMQVMSRIYDLTEGLKKLQCRTLISVGENSPFHSEALHMCAKMDKKFNALVEVQACGSLVTEEQPHAMLIPIEYFLMGYGFYRPPPRLFCSYGTNPSPTSPLSPSCISAELLSPESLGLKLKPIKTRVAAMDD